MVRRGSVGLRESYELLFFFKKGEEGEGEEIGGVKMEREQVEVICVGREMHSGEGRYGSNDG